MIEVRPRRPGDEPAVNSLFEASFGYAPHRDHWTWKYERVPGKARSLVAVLPDGGIVAHVGALAVPAVADGRTAALWQLVDFMGSTRGLGLRPPLVRAGRQLLAGLPEQGDHLWVFGFPSERHFQLGSRAFGYRPLRQVMPLAGRLPGATASPGSPLEVSDNCADWAQSIWQACGVQSVERSAAFLNWRYHSRPDRYYRFYRFAAGRHQGFAVFGFHGEQAVAAELWLPASGDWRDWWAPLLAVGADLATMGMRSWAFWPEARYEQLLIALGLVPRGDVVRIGRRGDGERRSSFEFCFSMGDFDLT